jgi:hypothetical protein
MNSATGQKVGQNRMQKLGCASVFSTLSVLVTSFAGPRVVTTIIFVLCAVLFSIMSSTIRLKAKEGAFDALFFLRLSEGGERWDREECRKISLMESNAKCRYLKN